MHFSVNAAYNAVLYHMYYTAIIVVHVHLSYVWYYTYRTYGISYKHTYVPIGIKSYRYTYVSHQYVPIGIILLVYIRILLALVLVVLLLSYY